MEAHQNPAVRLRLLANPAEFQVSGSGPVGGGRRLALMAILAMRAGPVSRDELCELLWDPEPGTDTQHRLRELLSDTRRIHPDDVLITAGRLVSLSPEVISTDVLEFRAAAAEGRVLDAANIFEAEFLTGCSPRGASGFREWADHLGRQLNRERAAVRAKLVYSLRSQGEFEHAAKWAERLWRDDPDDMAAAQLFVETVAMTGDRAKVFKASGLLDDHFVENRIEVPGELKAAMVHAREIPEAPIAAFADLSTSHQLPALEGPPIVTDDARKPALHQRRKWTPQIVVAGFTLSLFALLALVRTNGVQNRAASKFGGGGTIVLMLPDTTHSLTFTGGLPTDTQAVQMSLADSFVVWGTRYSGARRSFAFNCPMPDGSHGVCVRSLKTGHTIRYPRIGAEDLPKGWSPDGSWLLVKSGKTERGVFQYDMFVVNTITNEVVRLTNDKEENEGSWSPDGTRIALISNGAGADRLQIRTIDGRRLIDQTFEGRVETLWSPDARALVLVNKTTRSSPITVVVGNVQAEIDVPLTKVHVASWSPDSRYLLVSGISGDRLVTITCRVSDCVRPDLTIPWNGLASWVPQAPVPYIQSVRFERAPTTIRAGEVVRLHAIALDQEGLAYRDANIEFKLAAPADAWIDSSGSLHTVRPERLPVVASAGGWRADTLLLDIQPTTPEAITIDEDWENGLNTSRWRLWGHPVPFVTSGHLKALNTNGDDMYPSGVVSTRNFSTANGVTLEWTQRTPLTGDLWQEVWIDFSTLPADSFAITHQEPYRVQGFQIRTPLLMYQPPEAVLVNSCGSHSGPFPKGLADSRWHSYVYQLHPDHTCDFIIDGVRVDRGRSNLSRVKPYRLVLGGRNHKTEILIDDVRLSEGPQWVVLPDNRAVRLNPRDSSTIKQ